MGLSEKTIHTDTGKWTEEARILFATQVTLSQTNENQLVVVVK